MRIVLMLGFLVLLLAGCQTASPARTLDGSGLATALNTSALPAANVHVYTAEDDPNHLLGRPNQYVAKINWEDTRLTNADLLTGTIEVFDSAADLHARQKYTETISQSGGAFAQYIVPNEDRLALMRLPHQLTPEQADAYKAWFTAL